MGGVAPDIIVNPLAFPSRMTIGMLVEMLTGKMVAAGSRVNITPLKKVFCLDSEDEERAQNTDLDSDSFEVDYKHGEEFKNNGDATPFNPHFSLHRVCSELKSLGFDGFGDEVMINGMTGEPMKCLIFTGVCFYQRLKHMVIDKVHARSRGGHNILTRQPKEGRKFGGGFRVGHMERDCFSADTPIALTEGVSLPLEQFNRLFNVWGWNGKGMVKSTQTNFKYKGKLPAFKMTLEDGRTITATKDHPFLTENGEWADLKDLKIGEDRLVCSVDLPIIDLKKDMKEINGYKVNFGNYEFDGAKYQKSMALARVVGLVTTDGHISKKCQKIDAYLGHLLDVETFTSDIELLTGKKPGYKMNMNTFLVKLPECLSSAIREMGVLQGAKVDQPACIPSFINNDTPLPIVREFLGGMFGGDGHAPCLSKHRNKRDLMKSVAISQTKHKNHLESLKKKLKTIKNLLQKCGVNGCTIQAPKRTTNAKQTNKDHYEIVLNIPLWSLIDFSKNIGFRYCVHKSQRLTAGVTYRRFREGVLAQRLAIVNRVDELTRYRKIKAQHPTQIIRTKKAISQAVKELSPILHPEAVPDKRTVNRLLTGKGNNIIRSTTFPTVENFLRKTGALKWFDDYGVTRNIDSLPVFYLKVLDIRPDGVKPMYDITVAKTESFLANGVVAHNCILAQGCPALARDRLMEQSDVYKAWVCKHCGIWGTVVNQGEGKPDDKFCRICETKDLVQIRLPYATKLLSQELAGMNIVPRILTS